MSDFTIIKTIWPHLFYIISLFKVDKEKWDNYADSFLHFIVDTNYGIKITSPDEIL